ncbi:MAG: FAD-dependent oxidoreductase [Candidatus Thermoplasmatota archaeon]|nr:FAD-dependent oxidoreductase [Candidatus Thermoplasmatota archaeon]
MGKISLFIPVNLGILFTIIGCVATMYYFPEYGMYSFFSLPIVIFLLLKQVHPNSTASSHAEDAVLFDMPTSGGEGKSVVVIGGGISGLSAAKYLVQAGCNVTLLEQREIVGGNNDPYLENGEHHATTVIITLPAQQPHYLRLCREFGLEQTPHEFEDLKGSIVFEDRELNTKMGSGIRGFLKFIYREATLKELFDGFLIFWKFYRQFKLRPESPQSVADVLGKRLVNSTVFTHFYMPWVGINTWCRFEDVERQPAHVFAAFIFEYALTVKIRDKSAKYKEDYWCVLDGRLIHELRDRLLSSEQYSQHLSTKVSNIERNEDGQLTIHAEDDKSWVCDAVIVATQPVQALPILGDVAPKRLVDELEKWKQMDCYVLFHTDFSDIGNKPWLHQTHRNESTGKLYITNTIKPRMGDLDAKYLITFVYNTENYLDFRANHMDESTIVKLFEPKLPIFNLDNSVDRNTVWREIDAQCTDVFWTQACRSGLQYHNNGIVSAKRVVRGILGHDW